MSNHSEPPAAGQETADYVVQVTLSELRILRGDSQAVHLWCILLRYADWQTGKCHPSRSTLATEMGVSTDTVDRILCRLRKVNLLDQAKRKKDSGDYTSNEYTLIRQRVSAPERLPPPEGSRTAAARVAADLRLGWPQGCGGGSRTAAAQTSTIGRVPENEYQETTTTTGDGGISEKELIKKLSGDPFLLIKAKDAVQTAIANGCTPAELDAIAEHWRRSKLWNRNQLCARIKRAGPGEAPHTLWSKPTLRPSGTGDPVTDAINEEFKRQQADPRGTFATARSYLEKMNALSGNGDDEYEQQATSRVASIPTGGTPIYNAETGEIVIKKVSC